MTQIVDRQDFLTNCILKPRTGYEYKIMADRPYIRHISDGSAIDLSFGGGYHYYRFRQVFLPICVFILAKG